jgi:hypothetical protein
LISIEVSIIGVVLCCDCLLLDDKVADVAIACQHSGGVFHYHKRRHRPIESYFSKSNINTMYRLSPPTLLFVCHDRNVELHLRSGVSIPIF